MIGSRRLSSLTIATALAATLLCGPVSAQALVPAPAGSAPPTVDAPFAVLPPGKTPVKTAPTGGVLDAYSRYMFAWNKTVYGKIDQFYGWWYGPQPTKPTNVPAANNGGFGNVVANLVNEPVTAVTALAVGDVRASWRSVERFGINSTAGLLGYYDTATAWGFRPIHNDAGLSLCKAGVGEGGYVVLPFVGPRTVRDAVADIVLTNAVLWYAAGSLLGTGASLQTIVVAESVEIVTDIVATRQIDPQAKAIGFIDYDSTRERYLAQRRARCAVLRGEPLTPPKAG